MTQNQLMSERHYKDDEIISMLKAGGADHEKGIRIMINQFKPKVMKVVLDHLIKKDDAELYFFDAITKGAENAINGKYRADSSLSTYISSIAKYKVFEDNRKVERRRRLDEKRPVEEETFIDPEKEVEDKELMEQILKALDQIGSKCKQLLILWADGFKFAEIAQEMKFSDEHSARVAKHRCVKKLKNNGFDWDL